MGFAFACNSLRGLSPLWLGLVVLGCAEGSEDGFADDGGGGGASSAVGGTGGAGAASVGGAGAAGGSQVGGGGVGGECTLGTPDACGSCDFACPGVDDDGTARTCSGPTADATCGYACKGEHYDVDGAIDNGCEGLDEPLQDTAATAVAYTLPDTVDPNFMSNPLNVVGYVYSDDAVHEEPPTERPLGRDDWYAFNAVGAGEGGTGMIACLGITNFPADNDFEICISDIGQPTFAPSACATTSGGDPSVCVTPPAATDAGNPYYVRVRKLAGSHSSNGYALFVKH